MCLCVCACVCVCFSFLLSHFPALVTSLAHARPLIVSKSQVYVCIFVRGVYV